MSKKSFLEKLKGKKESASVDIDGEVDHLWMKEDLDAEKPMQEKDPRIDTGILRNRIADKIAKMNNH